MPRSILSQREQFALRIGADNSFLPVEDGLYYRFQHRKAPFSRENAKTQNIGDPIPGMEKYWESKPGYSAFWHPDHLHQYLDEMGWTGAEDAKDRKVVSFRGTPVGEGADGEPRVMPHTDKPEASYSMDDFEFRKPDAPTRWNDHTWGEGPSGQMVDDGYRTLGGAK